VTPSTSPPNPIAHEDSYRFAIGGLSWKAWETFRATRALVAYDFSQTVSVQEGQRDTRLDNEELDGV
jgi:hypothetical protein